MTQDDAIIAAPVRKVKAKGKMENYRVDRTGLGEYSNEAKRVSRSKSLEEKLTYG